MRSIAAVLVMLIGIAFALPQLGNPGPAFIILMIAVAIALVIVKSGPQARDATASAPTAQSGKFVTVCLGLPSGSPTPVQVFAALPGYCRNLLRPDS